MKAHCYKTKGVCSKRIFFDLDNGVVRNVSFEGGCDGNLKGISSLVEGREAKEVADLLGGVSCGKNASSCPDQLSIALRKAMAGKTVKTASKPIVKPLPKPAVKPVAKVAAKTAAKAAAKPAGKAGSKPAAKIAAKTSAKVSAKPAV